MVALTQLVLPIFLSAVLVFVCSSLIHMVIKWHNKDYLKLSNEDAVRAAINGGTPPPRASMSYPGPWTPRSARHPSSRRSSRKVRCGALLEEAGMPGMGPSLVGGSCSTSWSRFSPVTSVRPRCRWAPSISRCSR